MRKLIVILSLCLCALGGTTLKAQNALDSLHLLSTDSQQIHLKDYRKSKAVVLIFTCNHCIYSKKYEDRLVEMINEFKDQGISFLLVNSNSPELSYDDRLELMKERALEKAFPAPYVQDPGARLARHLGATKTPEAFLGIWKESELVVIYSGKIDDNPLMANRVGNDYLRDAIKDVLNGNTEPKDSVPAVGCGIKMD